MADQGNAVGRLTPAPGKRFTFEGPDGQRVSFEGPPDATEADAHKVLLQHLGTQLTPDSQRSTPGLLKSAASGLIQGSGAPGDFSQKVLGNAPAQQPIDKDTYYGKLVDALNVARKHLELPTSQQVGDTVGMQPTQPVTPAEKAVQFGSSLLPGMAMGGSLAGRTAMGAAPAANAVRAMGMSPQGPASSIAQGAEQQLPFPAQNSLPQIGNAAQTSLLKQVAKEGLHLAGHAVGGPVGGMAARFAAGKFL